LVFASAVIVTGLAVTVRAAEPLEPLKLLSPAKLALTPVGYEPALIPESDAAGTEATPDAFVVAEPTEFPLRLKDTDLPLTGEPPAVNVAERAAAPPNVPLALATASPVAALTVNRVVPLLPAKPEPVAAAYVAVNVGVPAAGCT
jgi:hypothetical protein